MEAHYRAFGGKLVIKVEGSTIKDLFEQIGPVAEVLDGDDSCGKCGSAHIYPRAREAQGFTYYELVCSDCRAKLSFGQHKDGGTLWAKRADENGNALDNRGWIVYLGIAPAPKTAPSTPRPAPAQSEDPRLLGFIDRAVVPGKTDEVLAELCDLIRMEHGDKEADDAWSGALKNHGDPAKKIASIKPVVTFLWNRSMRKATQ